MDRRTFLAGSVAALCAAGPAFAASYQDEVVAQLKKQGFGRIRIERTLLGRVRILASRKDGRREIILNPRTGEILRDLWTANGKGASGGSQLLDEDGSRDADDDRDDDKDDDRDDDKDDDREDDDDDSGSDSDSDDSGSDDSDSGDGGGDDGEDD